MISYVKTDINITIIILIFKKLMLKSMLKLTQKWINIDFFN